MMAGGWFKTPLLHNGILPLYFDPPDVEPSCFSVRTIFTFTESLAYSSSQTIARKSTTLSFSVSLRHR